ncbi:DUF302 domain-containing protein [Salisediminibacterium selenitireducens]|uniref:DUF302 domain-containing protein n=1 Tax=Bacillus selenitireducens (strain ATCC 700615 / DSM 15326 / MLS10) TaxID=439292 RepID=D6XZ56_BACIE|nr:DUF302 domain-containing protein [Salisediminibacterium selenitireducens]ADI00341.1 conserved hypothetical protein [[Bacillus] selenitireducens MLS10]
MKKNLIIGIVIGAVLSAGLFLLVAFQAGPGMMMHEDQSKYDFDETIEVFEQQVAEAGWSVAGMHDMKEILDGHGHDVIDIKIYELCSSKYSAEILKLDDERFVSPLMPCRISFYEKSDGNTYISRMNSSLMAKPFGGVIDEVMQQAAAETEAILDHLID